MCVKNTAPGCGEDADLTPALFTKLAPLLPGLEALVLSGVGEPLLNPHLEEFIALARSSMPPSASIGFQTNGQILTPARAKSLLNAGLDRICLSLDSADPAVYGHIRGAPLAKLEEALTAIAAASTPGGKKLELGVEFVAMKENVHELPGLLEWAASRGASFAIVSQCLPYEPGLLPQTAYDPNTDRAVNFYHPWAERARNEGLNLDNYFKVLWKYEKTSEDRRLIDYVEEMKAAASKEEVFINLTGLLARDEEWYEEVARIFRLAAQTAQKVGLTLTLPEVLPRGERRCEFVEGDSMFVSATGLIHPCYFLWHGYRAFVNGREKTVTPRVFGDLNLSDPLAIWHSPGYAAFRANVKRYDYPYCSDCNLGKCCDYVQAEEFTQDCYLNEEPCGDCLWCKGVFNCLL